ncbi:hypothetical protein DL98DRAFT_567804 [Cadophora sp. DSE1049]|nr:hypothetical protein DL98DRAFT_567804 [Cadophora sp. DSE1049]
MWRLAEVIGAPRLQNAAMKALSEDRPWFNAYHDDAECQIVLGTAKNLQDCWNDTTFTKNEHYGVVIGADTCETYKLRQLCREDSYWQGKKRLLFLLDLMAFHGIEYIENMKIVHRGGDLAVHLGLAMDRIGFENEANNPRNPKNFRKYLVDETFPDYEDGSISDGIPDDSCEDKDSDLSVSEAEGSTAAAQVMEDDTQYDEDGIPVEDRNNGSSALVNNLKRVHPTGFFGDGEVEALVLGLPPDQRRRVMEEMAEDEM